MDALSPRDVLQALRAVVDPDTGHDLIRLGLLRDLKAEGRTVSFTLLLKDPTTPFARTVRQQAAEALRTALGDDLSVRVELDNEMIGLGDEVPIQQGSKTAPMTLPVRNTLAVASGKGGVGKSTVAVNLALALAAQGYDVGLVDLDIYGPSIPTMLGLHGVRPRVDGNRKIVPVEKHGLKILSMGFMVDPNKAVVWRGPMASSAVRQFLSDTAWGELDYLVLDLPPGTGDIQLTIVQTVPLTGALIVSTPQTVALADARKGVAMFDQVKVPVLGIAENMAYFTPPDLPDRKYYLFGEGGARRLAAELDVPFLGEIPIEQAVREGGDTGHPVFLEAPESLAGQAFHQMALQAVDEVALRNAVRPATQPIEILHR